MKNWSEQEEKGYCSGEKDLEEVFLKFNLILISILD
jgi:hypothetical protein